MVKENLPKEFSIYNGLTVSLMVLPINDELTVPITPFVESVVQYYQYYGYGHWKDECLKSKVYLIHGERFHGTCDKKICKL